MTDRSESPEDYWRRVEEEIGEPIELRCLAQYLDGSLDRPKESWGVLFVSDQAVYLRTLPTQGWQGKLKSLFGVGLDTREEPTLTRIALTKVTDVQVDKPETRWQHLIRPYPKERILVHTAEEWFALAPDADVEKIASLLLRYRPPC